MRYKYPLIQLHLICSYPCQYTILRLIFSSMNLHIALDHQKVDVMP